MQTEMDFLHAPEEKLETWRGLTRLAVISCVAVVILLSVLAATLT